MDQDVGEPGSVATWARVLAWVLVVGSCVMVLGVSLRLAAGHLPSAPWYQLAFFVLPAIWVLPVFWIVALTGRPPKHWFGLGENLWRVRASAERRSA
jgi:uncharacterized membrane protein YhdT